MKKFEKITFFTDIIFNYFAYFEKEVGLKWRSILNFLRLYNFYSFCMKVTRFAENSNFGQFRE